MRPDWQSFRAAVEAAAKRYLIPLGTLDVIRCQLDAGAYEHAETALVKGGQGRSGEDIEKGAIGCALLVALIVLAAGCFYLIGLLWQRFAGAF